MAQASTLVVDVRHKITALIGELDKIPAIQQRYVDLGGKEFVERYLKPEEGQENPTDITGDEFAAAMFSIEAIQALLNSGHRANLLKMLL